MATITQTGYVISSPSGISCGLKGTKVYLSIDEFGRVGEYKQPVIATFIPNQCELNKKLRIAKRWYCTLNTFATSVVVTTTEPAATMASVSTQA